MVNVVGMRITPLDWFFGLVMLFDCADDDQIGEGLRLMIVLKRKAFGFWIIGCIFGE
jgi:hypothetical protein